MKYKFVFIIFNTIIIGSFLVISLLPVVTLGWEYAFSVWQQSWISPVLFTLILIVIDSYFICNWKFFSYLEARDWDGIQRYLDRQLFKKSKIHHSRLMILLNTYLLQGNLEDIIRIGNRVKVGQPRLFEKMMVSFGTAFLIKKDNDGLIDFFQDVVKERDLIGDGWADWMLAFAYLRNKDMRLAGRRFVLLSIKGRNEMVRLLSLYVLIDIIQVDIDDHDCQRFLINFRNKYSPASWVKKIESKKSQLHVLLLCDFIQEAGEWCMKKYEISLPIVSANPKKEDYDDSIEDDDE